MNIETMYDRIKRLREEQGMSQEELAKKCGYTDRSTISKIEKGERNLPGSKIQKIAIALGVTPSYLMDGDEQETKGLKIPVLGTVVAGIPIEAVQEILDYEEISSQLASQGEFFALKVKGDSMEPKISAGDVVIVRKQEDVENGDIAIVLVNGNEATVKKIRKFEGGVNLIPTNPEYDVITYTNNEIMSLPVHIIGKVIELRAKF